MDAKGLIVLPGQGSVWEMSPGRSATLKLQSAETGERVMMFEEAAPAGTATLFHIHHNSDEMAYVLSGEITFKIGDQVTAGGSGTCAFMPRGIAHAWKISGVEAGRILFLYTPAEAGKWFEELQRLQRPFGSLDDAEVVQPASAAVSSWLDLPRSEGEEHTGAEQVRCRIAELLNVTKKQVDRRT